MKVGSGRAGELAARLSVCGRIQKQSQARSGKEKKKKEVCLSFQLSTQNKTTGLCDRMWSGSSRNLGQR